MKTFNDLIFNEGKARISYFENGYGVSVIRMCNTYDYNKLMYELAVLKNNKVCYSTKITDNVIGNLKQDQVTEIMLQIQKL